MLIVLLVYDPNISTAVQNQLRVEELFVTVADSQAEERGPPPADYQGQREWWRYCVSVTLGVIRRDISSLPHDARTDQLPYHPRTTGGITSDTGAQRHMVMAPAIPAHPAEADTPNSARDDGQADIQGPVASPPGMRPLSPYYNAHEYADPTGSESEWEPFFRDAR
jgi:hypothetical protein